MNQSLDKNGNWKGGVSLDNYRYTKRHREKFPLQEPARKVVYRALKAEKLVKPKYCQHPRCFETEIFAHHPDYEKPLLVLWLCRKHHSEIHCGVLDENEIASLSYQKPMEL